MGWIDYDRHARGCARDDLWGQVRRTVGGVPVAEEQIAMIVDTVAAGLALGAEDVLLDLACGNGALTSRLGAGCRASLGVDISPYLIGVADERFATPSHRFACADMADFAEAVAEPARFTKAVCYGSLPYLADADLGRLLGALTTRFTDLSHVYLGNLPDPARAAAFYPSGAAPDLFEPRSVIGVWRSAEAVAALAGPAWRVETRTMPPGFFAAHYRFDLLLRRHA